MLIELRCLCAWLFFKEYILLVLIDEHGCPGFKLDKGSTPYFIMAMVIFSDFLAADKASEEIRKLREDLRVKPEFRFSKSHSKVKDSFFQTICKHDFLVRALVVDKQKIYSPYLRLDKENFYSYFMRQLMANDGNLLSNAIIRIDGKGSKKFQKATNNYLKAYVGKDKIRKIKFVDSKKDNLVQLADMITGAIARSYNTARKDNQRWLNMLRTRIDNIWLFK